MCVCVCVRASVRGGLVKANNTLNVRNALI